MLNHTQEHISSSRILNQHSQYSRTTRRTKCLLLNLKPSTTTSQLPRQAITSHVNSTTIKRSHLRHISLIRVSTRHHLHGFSTLLKRRVQRLQLKHSSILRRRLFSNTRSHNAYNQPLRKEYQFARLYPFQ